jgi:hypothetical protein
VQRYVRSLRSIWTRFRLLECHTIGINESCQPACKFLLHCHLNKLSPCWLLYSSELPLRHSWTPLWPPPVCMRARACVCVCVCVCVCTCMCVRVFVYVHSVCLNNGLRRGLDLTWPGPYLCYIFFIGRQNHTLIL